MATDDSVLYIGHLASRAGVSIDTVRYYERRRLLPRAARSSGGFRIFGPEAVERILFIKHAQELGFSLEEIGQLFLTGGAAECRRVRDLLRAKLTDVDQRIKSMNKFRRTLAHHLSACEQELNQRGNAAECPVMPGRAQKLSTSNQREIEKEVS